MPTFPTLKTAAVMQYPATRGLRFQNQSFRFLDGAEQRYRDRGEPLRRWTIPLSQLDEGEMAAVEDFFAANRGMLGTFAFTDPWDGRVYPNCSLERDDIDLISLAEMSGATSLTVIENRG